MNLEFMDPYSIPILSSRIEETTLMKNNCYSSDSYLKLVNSNSV